MLQSGNKLNLAKLHRLKAARWIQLIARTEEANRRHRRQNVNLRDQQLLDLDDPAQRERRFRDSINLHQSDGGVDLVQDLLEPKFIRLMHRDEEQLIVMSGRRQARLQVDQFRHAQIFVVRERSVFAVFVGHFWSAVARHLLWLYQSREQARADLPAGIEIP